MQINENKKERILGTLSTKRSISKKLSRTKRSNSGVFYIIRLLAIVLWGFQLIGTGAYYVSYALLIMITAVCLYMNRKASEPPIEGRYRKYANVIINIFAILFTCMVAFANYKMWDLTVLPGEYEYGFKWCYHLFIIIVLFAGGYFAFKNIFITLISNIKKISWENARRTINPKTAFAVCFILLVVTRLLVLFLTQYPGDLTSDSTAQVAQFLNGNYSNHHPFYHTMTIKFFVTLGMSLFNDINAAVATYSVFQIVFTSFCFAFAVSTMAKMKAPRWIVISSILFFLLMPYHITYAITMWKDVMFGCFVLLLVTAIYRCMNNNGHWILDYIILAIAGLGTCLFRSNGFFVFAILTIVFVAFWKMKNKRMLIVFISTIIISFVMKYIVLAQLGVTQPATIESLSIPVQQIARVVYEGNELDDWQRSLLSEVIDIDQIPEKYKDYISDPIKNLVRQRGNHHLLTEKKFDYIKLYLSLGIKYPMSYLRAWIDQTKGYWNSGYEYWRWYLGVYENDMGIAQTTHSATIDLMLHEYLWLFTNVQGLRLFLSIGLFIWIDILMLMIALLRKDKVGAFISLPILVIVASLLIATPVYAEFRYIYAAFCTLPFVAVIALRPLDTSRKGHKWIE